MADHFQPKLYNFGETIGFATDLPPVVREMQHLENAINLYPQRNKSWRKFGGQSLINGTAISTSPDVTGFIDWWFSGTAGTSTQQLVCMTADSRIFADTTSGQTGTLTNITGGATITSGATPYFISARDNLIILNTAADVVLAYTGSGNVASLGGSPPAGRCGIYHANRVWITNTNANPSRVTYGSSTAINDYTGADTGTIDIDPEDGDRNLAVAINRGRLFIFKGPNKGSIHIIQGRTPSTFARDLLIRGNPIQSAYSVFDVGNDIWIVTGNGVFSLESVQAYGDWKQAEVTPYLRDYFINSLNRTKLGNIRAVNYEHRSVAVIAATSAGSAENDTLLGVSYIDPKKPKIFTVTGRSPISVGTRINPSSKIVELCTGTTDGFVKREDVASNYALSGGGGYSTKLTTPSIVVAAQDKQGKEEVDQPVNVNILGLKTRPTGNYNATINLQLDDRSSQAFTFNQGVTGALWGTAIFDTDVFGGGSLQVVSQFTNAGNCRSARLDVTTPVNTVDFEVYEAWLEYKDIAKTRVSNLETGA